MRLRNRTYGPESRTLSQIGNDEESGSQSCTSSSSGIADSHSDLNPDVLEHLFSFVDVETLKNCRLVSKTWNEEATAQLGSKCWFRQKTIGQKDSQGSFSPSEKEEVGLTCQILSGLSSSTLFRNFEFDLEWLMNKTFQKLLKKFGSTLKLIAIRDRKQFEEEFDVGCVAKRMGIVRRILTQWCPSLSAFQMEVAREVKHKTSQMSKVIISQKEFALIPPKQIKWVKPMKLRELKIEGVLTEYQSDFWIELIKACPFLTTLSIFCIPDRIYLMEGYVDNQEEVRRNIYETSTCNNFFKELSNLPEVTKKLVEFSWNGAWIKINPMDPKWELIHETSCIILKFVSNMEFSGTLKKIGIGPSIDYFDGEEFYLTRLLVKLNACGTEEIVLHGKYWIAFPPKKLTESETYEDDDEDIPEEKHDDLPHCECEEDNHTLECFRKIDHIPQMINVKSVLSFAESNYELGAFHFVHKFPNLKKYSMNPEQEQEDVFWEPRVDRFAPQLHYMGKFPHYKLEELVVNPVMENSLTLELIVKGFPNLKYLKFEMNSTLCDPSSGPTPTKISFLEALDIVSKLEGLKKLAVTIKCLRGAFPAAFGYGNYILLREGYNWQPKIFFADMKKLIFRVSNLITSSYYKVTEFKTMEFKGNQIRVEFVLDVGTTFFNRN